MSEALFDSNILIDLFNGVEAARTEWGSYPQAAISVVSWIEIMAGVSDDQSGAFRRF